MSESINTGNSNTGYRNTGDWNQCDHETGFFIDVTKKQSLTVGDKEGVLK